MIADEVGHEHHKGHPSEAGRAPLQQKFPVRCSAPPCRAVETARVLRQGVLLGSTRKGPGTSDTQSTGSDYLSQSVNTAKADRPDLWYSYQVYIEGRLFGERRGESPI